jgi:hypothetical protein
VAGWQALDFQLDEPHYYQYAYNPTALDAFTATAVGDIDCDTTTITYALNGTAVNGNPAVVLVKPAPGTD